MKRFKGRHRRLLVYLTVSTTVFFVVSPGIALADEIVDPVDTTVTVDPTTVDATVVDPALDATVVDPTPDATVVVDPAPDATVVDPAPDATVTVDPAPDVTVVDPAPDATVTVDPAPDATVTVDPAPDATVTVDPAPRPVSDPIADQVSPVVDEPAPDPVSEPSSGPAPETATDPFPEVVSDPITDVVTDVVSGPVPETAIDPFPEVITDPIIDVATDPIIEPIAEPIPEPIAEPIPAPVVEAIPAPVVLSPEVVVPITTDEIPMTVTATTELFFSEGAALPRITSEELPQKLQDDPFNAPQHEGTTLTSTAIVLMSSLATTPSKAGSVQVDDPASCSGLGSAPCGVRNSPNDPGSFVQSIAELLRQLALTGSGALDLLKLALILAIVGAFAIWGTRRRPVVSVAEPKRTLRSGDLLHRHHRVTIGSDRPGEWITIPHAVVRQRSTWRIPLATPPSGAPTSVGSAARRPGSGSFVAGSVARVSICPTTTDRTTSELLPAYRGNGR